jgi:hypothetical protein
MGMSGWMVDAATGFSEACCDLSGVLHAVRKPMKSRTAKNLIMLVLGLNCQCLESDFDSSNVCHRPVAK